MMKQKMIAIASWLIALWSAKVFLFSLPYKFTDHPDTLHIFGSIGLWMQETLGVNIGMWFSTYGAYVVGSVELIASLVLLSPAVFWLLQRFNVMKAVPSQHLLHGFGGLMAAGVMIGAVFFHLFTPLGIEVIHQGKGDNGSLFYAALSILVLGIFMFVINLFALRNLKAKSF